MRTIPNKNRQMKAIESETGVKIEEILRAKFVDESKSIEQIAKELQISYPTVIRWLKLAGIRSRRLQL